jgi:hypothetical protein
MAHPLSESSKPLTARESIADFSLPFMQQPICQRVSPFVIYLKNKTSWPTNVYLSRQTFT